MIHDTPQGENLPLDVTELPTVAALEWLKLSPRYPWAVLISTLAGWTLILIAAEAAYFQVPSLIEPPLPPLLVGLFEWRRLLIPLALLWMAKNGLQAVSMRYRVRQEDVHFFQGVIWHHSKHLPFSRIQHVGTASGPLERWLGLRRLIFYTAGSVGADLSIPGLPVKEADRLRQYIIDRAGLSDDG